MRLDHPLPLNCILQACNLCTIYLLYSTISQSAACIPKGTQDDFVVTGTAFFLLL